jgi:hypothetical protein
MNKDNNKSLTEQYNLTPEEEIRRHVLTISYAVQSILWALQPNAISYKGTRWLQGELERAKRLLGDDIEDIAMEDMMDIEKGFSMEDMEYE